MKPFTLAPIFRDHAVFQQNKPIKVWGTGQNGDSVTISLNDESTTTIIQKNQWKLSLPEQKAQSSLLLTVSVNDCPTLEIHDVAIGEVWIAGGQSNMAFLLDWDADRKEALATANNPDIRYFEVPRRRYFGEEDAMDLSQVGFWRLCDSENAPYFSAVCYYYARYLADRLHVPIGIVGCDYNGTTASAWLNESYLQESPDLRVYLTEYKNGLKKINPDEYEKRLRKALKFSQSALSRKVSAKIFRGEIPHRELQFFYDHFFKGIELLPVGPKSANRPGGLYATMQQTIAGYSARGVIWYQGESDDVHASIYRELFAALISCWRNDWQDELPFIFVQLAPFQQWLNSDGTFYPELRYQQQCVEETVPKTYMVSIMDAGMRWDIHPKQKKPVGERLALMALCKVYGQDVLGEAPKYFGYTYRDDRINLIFDHAGEGLYIKDGPLNGLQLLVNHQVVTPSEIMVNNNTLSVFAPQLKDAVTIEVRFLIKDFVEANLYNSAGLPAKPFQTHIR